MDEDMKALCKKQYDKEVIPDSLEDYDPNEPETVRRELAALVKYSLDEPMNPKTFDKFFELKTNMRKEQMELVAKFSKKLITPEEYLDNFISLLKKSMSEIEALLGKETFLAIFGEAGYHSEVLVDRESFLKENES